MPCSAAAKTSTNMVSRRWPLLAFFFSFFTLLSASLALDTINRTLSLKHSDTLESSGGSFRLGFFAPAGSTSAYRYLGIWFNKDRAQTIVWVANRQNPLNGSAGVFKLGDDGRLLVLDGTGIPVWSSRVSTTEVGSNPEAQLLETGNLVVRSDHGRLLWQSFDEPGDTLLPGMRLLLNLRTRYSRQLTSWKSAADPSPGNFSYRLHGTRDKLPYVVVMDGSAAKFSTGPLVGVGFTGFTEMNVNGIFNTTAGYDGDEVYYVEKMVRNSSLIRLFLSPAGVIEHWLWSESAPAAWKLLWYGPTDDCDRYATCGPYAICRLGDFPPCRCLRGFQPRSPQEWLLGNGAAGCVRQTKVACGDAGAEPDGFLKMRWVKLPDVSNTTLDRSMSLEGCRVRCVRDCSCTAYASAGVDGEEGRGCINWHGDLVDMRNYSATQGQDLFVRVAAADLDTEPTTPSEQRKKGRGRAFVAPVVIVSMMVLLVLCGCLVWRKCNMKTKTADQIGIRKRHREASVGEEDLDLPLHDFETVISATNNFSSGNKIGEGGFGVVYKGIMKDGQKVAVKRLSWTSVQGLNEFMNEVMLIAKLQHKNLVRLLGCCIHGEERILIYEFMENKSLDFFIFDETKRGLLGWRKRLDIISGIARGLLYLHHDSRFTIIHRDLKAGNILLDGEMNPKISDFGTARIFGANQNVEKTKRVIGTYGYMSPEYVINGTISVKSDVFSFGVLVLETISGIRNRGIFESGAHLNLLSYAWRLWQEGKCLELIDATTTSSCPANEVLRCIQVGLLCVQEHAVDRPTMSKVVMMLGSETFPLPQPKRPGLLVIKSPNMTMACSSSNQELHGTNGITITDFVEGR